MVVNLETMASSNIDELTEVLGASIVIPRGAQFEDFITEYLKNTNTLLEVNASV